MIPAFEFVVEIINFQRNSSHYLRNHLIFPFTHFITAQILVPNVQFQVTEKNQSWFEASDQ